MGCLNIPRQRPKQLLRSFRHYFVIQTVGVTERRLPYCGSGWKTDDVLCAYQERRSARFAVAAPPPGALGDAANRSCESNSQLVTGTRRDPARGNALPRWIA
jgi:hypothetical protein